MTAKPVLILQHKGGFPPGYFGDYLARSGRPTVALRVRSAQDVPGRSLLERVAGLVLTGGEGSALAGTPWLAAEIDFVRAALDAGTPVFGQGLGGRLLACAAGGTVRRPHAPEIGWQPLSLTRCAAESEWLDILGGGPHRGFMDHDEIAAPPPDATVLLSSALSACQLFVAGHAIGTGFHPEITRAALAAWLSRRRSTLPGASLGVQTVAEIEQEAGLRIAEGRKLANALYQTWSGWLPP